MVVEVTIEAGAVIYTRNGEVWVFTRRRNIPIVIGTGMPTRLP